MERKNLALLCAGVVCFWLFALAFGTAQGSGLHRQSPAVQTAVQPQGPVQLTAEPPALELPCRAACLIDQQTGTVLYEKNADQQMPIASITKVMTLLTVILMLLSLILDAVRLTVEVMEKFSQCKNDGNKKD